MQKLKLLLTAILITGCNNNVEQTRSPVYEYVQVNLVYEDTPTPIVEKSEVECLAKNIYFEARGEPIAGQLAVAHVTVNRTNDKRFPDSICEVIYQGKINKNTNIPVRDKCQFKWWCDGKSDKPNDKKSWNKSLEIANNVMYGRYQDPTNGALWFHTTEVNPSWKNEVVFAKVIGEHIFYR